MKLREGACWNYSYYPILFPDQGSLLFAQKLMNDEGIFPRRYFYPSLNNLPYLKANLMPVSDDISKRILCLPLYIGLKQNEINKIISLVNKSV